MTILDLIARLVKMFPRHAAQIEAWEDEYRSALKRYQGDVLAGAYGRVMNGWDSGVKAAFPKPADFAQHCRPGDVKGDKGPPAKDRMEYLEAHLTRTVEKSVADARRRMIETHGEDVANAGDGDIRFEAQRCCNRYVQIRFLHQHPKAKFYNDDQLLNGAQWKLSDGMLDAIAGRVLSRREMAGGNIAALLRRTA